MQDYFEMNMWYAICNFVTYYLKQNILHIFLITYQFVLMQIKCIDSHR